VGRLHGEADLLTALRSGQAFCAEILAYTGQLWLSVEGNPMGSISVKTAATRQLTSTATALPSSGVIEVVRGPVDYPGTTSPDPATTVVTTLPASAFTSTGSTTATIDTATSCFVRINLLDTTLGRRIAFSNPSGCCASPHQAASPAPASPPTPPPDRNRSHRFVGHHLEIVAGLTQRTTDNDRSGSEKPPPQRLP